MRQNWIQFCEKNLATILFTVALLVGTFGLPRHGITWDEPAQRIIGAENYGYVFLGNNALKESFTRDYGPAFELPLHAVERAVEYKDLRYLYWMRHFFTHVFFLFGALYLFKTINALYQNKILAGAGFLLLVLMPTIYGHSFFNTKDIPFLSLFIITYYHAVRAWKEPSWRRYIYLGICMGLLINLRIVGLILLGCIAGLMVIEVFLKNKARPDRRMQLQYLLVFIFTTAAVLLISFPYLWWDPWNNFMTALKNMSKFRWEGWTLVNGKMERTIDLPWTYVPVWFGVTVPLFYQAIGVLGIGTFLVQWLRKPLQLFSDAQIRFNAIFLACFMVPPLAAIILKSVLLDGWRHMFFIYPSFVLLAVFGLHTFWNTKLRPALLAVTAVGFVFAFWAAVRLAPFQHLYFNSIVNNGSPEKLRKNFEFDYWGATYLQAYEYLVAHDDRPVIKVKVANYPGLINVDMLPLAERRRIELVENLEDADYFITNYRDHPDGYPEMAGKEWYSVKVDNSSANTIFKMK